MRVTGKKTAHYRALRAAAKKHLLLAVGAFFLCSVFIYAISSSKLFAVTYDSRAVAKSSHIATTTPPKPAPVLDIAAYDKKILQLANHPLPVGTSTATTTITSNTKVWLWPPKTVYPNPGALLPFNRIVAYYGNFYSTQMGALGQYPAAEMISRLQNELARWQAADPTTPTLPAIENIAETAQGSPGAGGKYRLRMPDSQIDHALDLANQVHGIVILDIQAGLSTTEIEVPELEKYLKMPQVHLALDPEFAMHGGAKPGTVIGSLDASDINWAANYLAKLVRDNNLPPKILVIHRFTEDMVTGYKRITPLPEVQVVMQMDGWGDPAKKKGTYTRVIYPEPVQFTGFKLFYKNDLKPPSTRMMTPTELLALQPRPIFIQYQ